MPTIIDELVVTLGLDPKNFVSGQKKATDALDKTKKAATKGSKEVSEGAGDMLKAFGGLQGKLLGIAALFTSGVGITEFSKKMAAVTTQVTYLARQVGVSAQELETWDAAGAKVGATAGEISGSIAGVYSALAQGQLHGTSSIQKYFMAMGISPVDPKTGRWKTPTQIYTEMSGWAQGQDPRLATQLFREMGQSPGMINLLLQGPEKIHAALEQNKKNVLSDEDRKKFEGLNTSFHQLAVDADRLGRAIALDLLPGVKQFIDFIDRIVTRIKPASPEQVQTFTDKHLPEMGGSKSIFGRIKSWWNGDKGESEKSKAESDANAAPAAPSRPSAGGHDIAPRSRNARAAAAKGYMMDQLRREGVPDQNLDAAASLLAGQAIAESGLDPNLTHDSGTGFGIYGARDDPRPGGTQRRSRMLAWLRRNGYANNSLEGQSRYMAFEAMNDRAYRASRRALMSATPGNMAFGTRVLTRNFESPRVDNSGARYANARVVFGIPVASDVRTNGAADIIPHPGLMALQGAGNVSHNNTTSSTSINNLIVNSNSDDPRQHAADVASTLKSNTLMNQGNMGPN